MMNVALLVLMPPLGSWVPLAHAPCTRRGGGSAPRRHPPLLCEGEPSADSRAPPANVVQPGGDALDQLFGSSAAGAPAVVRSTCPVPAVAPLSAAERRRNVLLAAGSSALAAALYVFQRMNPADPLKLLRLMEAESPKISAALANGRPTCVEFFAPWCESCKEMAPSMRKLELELGRELNFVVLDGEAPANRRLVQLFGVDGIPHFALVDAAGTLKATLVGFVPQTVMVQKLGALREGTL